MKRTIVAAVVALAALTGCNTAPDKAACEQALRDSLAKHLSDQSLPAETAAPSQCKGVSDADLQAMAERIMATAMPTP